MSGKSAYLVPLIWYRKKKERHLSDSNTRGQRPTAYLKVAGDPVNHSGKVTYDSHGLIVPLYLALLNESRETPFAGVEIHRPLSLCAGHSWRCRYNVKGGIYSRAKSQL